MKPLDILIIAVLTVAFVIAFVYSVRNSKKGCSGDCANCGKSCKR